jgi:5-hydroxyisourate hydrolase-like protein (transthyretin family)
MATQAVAGRLTTHVLDTAAGRSAAGLPIELFRHETSTAVLPLASVRTNADGRGDAPLLAASCGHATCRGSRG